MNDYRPSTPRPVLGIAAVAMTAATFGLFVFAPAMMGSGGESLDTQMAKAASSPRQEAAIVLTRIEVRGVRETTEASAAATSVGVKGSVEPASADVPAVYRVAATRSGSLMSADGRISQERSPVWKR